MRLLKALVKDLEQSLMVHQRQVCEEEKPLVHLTQKERERDDK